MSFSNFENLVTNVADWLHRDDMTDRIPDFIRMAESRINRLLPSRQAETERALTGTISSRTISLPSGFKQLLGLWLTTYSPRQPLIYKLPERLTISTSNAQPHYFTLDGANIAFDCPLDQAYTFALRYREAYNLEQTNTNYLLDNYPGLYLYATLVEAAIYLRDDERLAQWKAIYDTELEEAKRSEAQNKDLATLAVDTALTNRGRFNIYTGDYFNVP
jgi:hypothetical protein